MGRFIRELKRRNVYQVAVSYLAVAFVGFQAVKLLIPSTTLPSWADELILAFLIAGFPVALVVAWAFELTPEGVRRTRTRGDVDAERGDGGDRPGGRRAVRLLVGLGVVAAAVAGGWYLMGSGTDREPPAGPRSIAVLPFKDVGGGETGAVTEGMHVDLQTRLSQISGLKPISRTSVQRYRESSKTTREIARELGVRWVLEGDVQTSGGRIEVSVRLIDPTTDTQEWAEQYGGHLTADRLFAMEADITKEIARSLQAQISPGELDRVERRPTADLEAHRLQLRGRALLDLRTEAGIRRAEQWFRRAIARDSTYALAWVGMADALGMLESYGFAPPDSVLPAAERAARRALELDPGSGEAYASLAMLSFERGKGPTAMDRLDRAVELRPGYAEAHNWTSWISLLLGRHRRALRAARRAVTLDPLSPEAVSNLALSHLAFGQFDSARVTARRSRELQPGYPTGALYHATALLSMDRYAAADTILAGLSVPWAPSAPSALRGMIRVARGDTAGARSLLSRLEREAESPYYPGLLQAALGRRRAAFAAFASPDGWSASAKLAWPNLSLRYLHPEVLGSLREEPPYQEVLRTINQAWGLEPDGGLPASDGEA